MRSVKVLKRRVSLGAMTILVAAGLSACATPPEDPVALEEFEALNDPLEPANRVMFDVNMAADRYFLKPVAKGYRTALPAAPRNGIRNVLNNLESPLIFANDLLQGEIDRAGITLVRFIFNSTIGLGGLFDVVKNEGYPRHTEDFGQTLAVWGAPEGPYLVLPLLGPRSVRHGVGTAVEWIADPVDYLLDDIAGQWAVYTRTAVDIVDSRSRNIESFEAIEKSSIDLYATVRSAYRQRREQEIANGADTPDGVGADEFEFTY